MRIKQGSTGVTRCIFIEDSASPGNGLTGLAWDTSSLIAYYCRDTSDEAVGFALQDMVLGTWVSGGFVEVDSVHMPGVYQFGLPDEALTNGAMSVRLMLSGASGMFPAMLEVELPEAVELDTLQSLQLALGLNVDFPLLDSPDRVDQDPASVYWTAINGSVCIVDYQFAGFSSVSGNGAYYSRVLQSADCGAMAVITQLPGSVPGSLGMITLGLKYLDIPVDWLGLDYRITYPSGELQLTLRDMAGGTTLLVTRVATVGDKIALVSVGDKAYGFFCSALDGVWEYLGTITHACAAIRGYAHLWLNCGSMISRVGCVYSGSVPHVERLLDQIDEMSRAYQAKVWLIDDDEGGADHYVACWFKNGQPVESPSVITGVLISVITASDGTELVGETAMDEVDTPMFRYDEAVNRVVDGAAYIAKVTATIDGATRTWHQPVGRDSYA